MSLSDALQKKYAAEIEWLQRTHKHLMENAEAFYSHGADYGKGYETKPLRFPPPKLVFVHELEDTTSGWGGRKAIYLNLAAFERNAENALLKLTRVIPHELSHSAHDDSSRFNKEEAEITSQIELRADREAARIIGSPVPLCAEIWQKNSDVLGELPEKLTPEIIREQAAKLGNSYKILPEKMLEETRSSPGYPFEWERLDDLSKLDFGWDHPVSKYTNISLQTNPAEIIEKLPYAKAEVKWWKALYENAEGKVHGGKVTGLIAAGLGIGWIGYELAKLKKAEHPQTKIQAGLQNNVSALKDTSLQMSAAGR